MMNYQELREAYKEAEMPFDEHFQKASMLIPFGTPQLEANNAIKKLLSEWLKEYSATKSKTKKGGVLRKIAYYLSYLVPFIKIKNEKG